MSASSRPNYSHAATAAFAEIVARHDRGENVDFEAAFRGRPELEGELRALHANWMRLDRLLGGLQGHDSALDSLERAIRRRDAPADERTRNELSRLSSSERAKDRYVVRERLARGGMGEIVRVFDRDLQRDLAMKLIRARGDVGSKSPDGRLLRRFLTEARLTGRLDHPGIVPVHDIGVDAEGRLYFTMPLVRGKSLAEILDLARERREGWTEPRVLEVILKVCDTLAYAHAQGVVHRDLKPANVMVGRFGETYVMDWGLARVLSEIEDGARDPSAERDERSALATGDGDVLGTPAYMAPEQAAGELDEVGPRSDVYAVGAILYHLLAGRMPYADTATQPGREVVKAVLAGPPTPIEDLVESADPELVAIAEKAMARSSSARYADMAAMAADVRAYVEGRVVLAHEIGAWAETKKWIARNRGLALALSASVVLAIVGSSLFSWREAHNAAEILRLADVARLKDLEARADTLWPALPEKAGAMRAWLADAEELAARRPRHEAALAGLRERAQASASGAFRFATSEDQWRHDTLAALVDGLARLAGDDPRGATITSVRTRIETAQDVEKRSLVEAAGAWNAALADVHGNPLYEGLVLRPQMGLVPLGRDPVSGLHEFAHVASGRVPLRDASGRLVLDGSSAIVLVLLPRGRFKMGSQRPVEGQPSDTWIDPMALSSETPRREVELDAFFLAKHEMTQAQWMRLTGTNPSYFGRAASDPSAAAELPVDSVSWHDAQNLLAHAGLDLPTEAQWEYAARARTTTRWWCGNDPAGLRGLVNGGATRTASLVTTDPRVHDLRSIEPRVAQNERAIGTLRVDAKGPNAFGLLNVLGNVAEWTLDLDPPDLSSPMRAGDGLFEASERGLRVARGGSYESDAPALRCAARFELQSEIRDHRVGVRAMRRLEP